jgi:hypothetical protein
MQFMGFPRVFLIYVQLYGLGAFLKNDFGELSFPARKDLNVCSNGIRTA